jgi:tRNA (guanine6-N2)-methyltransferase
MQRPSARKPNSNRRTGSSAPPKQAHAPQGGSRRGGPPPPSATEWVAHVPAGCEDLAAEEIRSRLDGARTATGECEVLFTHEEPFSPEKLRCSEVCFLRILSLPSTPDLRAGPYELLPAFERAAPRIHAAYDLAEAAGLGSPRTVRFVTRMIGRYPYPRQHLRDQVEGRFAGLLGRKYRRVDENGFLEIWVTAGRKVLSVDLRVSGEELRHRSYQERHREGGLRPAVAAALIRYSRPQADELFCDPFCGTGTLGIERSHYGLRYSGLFLGDRDVAATSAAALNFGRLHEPKRICAWDARALPLADASVDRVVTNPPFGNKIRVRDLPGLYVGALSEIARVLRPDGRAVLVVGDANLLRSSVESVTGLREQSCFGVELQGRPATVVLLQRTDEAPATSPDRTSRRSRPARRPSSRGR